MNSVLLWSQTWFLYEYAMVWCVVVIAAALVMMGTEAWWEVDSHS